MKSPILKSQKAFTLLELLAVIAILGVLVAMTIPMFRSVQTDALRAKNISNLRQIGLGIVAFYSDNNGNYPGNSTTSEQSNTRYAHLIFPYMGGQGKEVTVTDPKSQTQVTIVVDVNAYRSPVFHSPATPPSAYLGKGGDATWGVYGANQLVLSSDQLISPVRAVGVEKPSVTVLVAEKNAMAGSAVLSTQGPYPKVAAGPAANLRNDRKPAADPNGSGPCGFVFADGHAEIINLETLRPPLANAWPGTLSFKPVN